RALLSAIPVPEPGLKRERMLLEGDPPSPIDPPSGCRFRTRCPVVKPVCGERTPELKLLKDGQLVACHVSHGEA
ncbi:MAG: oligopeptide/dipeptide ABC transporter ATP-binding protein, partial [Alphaproteobacteria bacterium]